MKVLVQSSLRFGVFLGLVMFLGVFVGTTWAAEDDATLSPKITSFDVRETLLPEEVSEVSVAWSSENASKCSLLIAFQGSSTAPQSVPLSGGTVKKMTYSPTTPVDVLLTCATSKGASDSKTTTLHAAPGGNDTGGGGGTACNNGTLNSGEACDNGSSNGSCPATCSTSCTLPP